MTPTPIQSHNEERPDVTSIRAFDCPNNGAIDDDGQANITLSR